jgi:hypothetical protein
MLVSFLFIEQAANFQIEMEYPPRLGELINMEALIQEDFENLENYQEFIDEEIVHRLWRVVDIGWTPAANGKSTVTVFLDEDVKQEK